MPGDQRCHPYRPEDDPKADGGGAAPPELHCRVQAQVLLVPPPCAFPCHLLPLGSTQVGSSWGEPTRQRQLLPMCCVPSALRPALVAT